MAVLSFVEGGGRQDAKLGPLGPQSPESIALFHPIVRFGSL